MVVITIIVILISMAIPIYTRSIIRAKESVLYNNLTTLRTVIDHYSYDKQKGAQSYRTSNRRLSPENPDGSHGRQQFELAYDYGGCLASVSSPNPASSM